jgi:hypothetical protein
MRGPRDTIIRQAQEQAKHSDTLIMQKVNASHRLAFIEKYPGQVEHVLRLLIERLQAGLDKRDNVAVEDPDTWKLSSLELANLSQAVLNMHTVRESLKTYERTTPTYTGYSGIGPTL